MLGANVRDGNMVFWKERNMGIFRNESRPTFKIKDIIITQIRETMQSFNHNSSKNSNSGQDLRILEMFHLKEWSLNIPVAHANPDL